jgi:hypothetical protein
MIACNQNGVVGRRIYAQDNLEVWQAPRRNRPGQGWLGIFNRNTNAEPARVRLTKIQLGLADAHLFALSDIWRKKSVSLADAPLELELEPDDVSFVAYHARRPGIAWRQGLSEDVEAASQSLFGRILQSWAD